MAVSVEKLAGSKVAFQASPQPSTVVMFLSQLREAHEGGDIGDEEFNDGLGLIEEYLWKGGSVVVG